MVFSNLVFLYLFLPLNLLLYFSTGNRGWRNAVLITFSLFFYAWGEPVWVTLLLFSSLLDYMNGLLIERFRGRWQAKAVLIESIAINLSLLGVFKYGGFLIENLNLLTGLALPVPQVSLPIGISFYTFQTLSYTIDVYRGGVQPQRSLARFLMYVSLYPQLVAGPIVRYSDVSAQIDERRTKPQDLSAGAQRFVHGLAKKVLFANVAGELAKHYLDAAPQDLSVLGAWFGVLLYALQIYYDFSGYSDMAIGLGRIFGFTYPENFRYPYLSRSAAEFWRRWHISLGSFFRDYVYIPLGGNRRHVYRNLLVVWFLTGLWHGASWNFVLWGLFWGLLILLERLFLQRVLEKLPNAVSHLYLLFAMLVGWALFYFTDLSALGEYLAVMFGAAGCPLWDPAVLLEMGNNCFWMLAAILFTIPIYPCFGILVDYLLRDRFPRLPYGGIALCWNGLLLLACTALLVGQSYNPFLYFRF